MTGDVLGVKMCGLPDFASLHVPFDMLFTSSGVPFYEKAIGNAHVQAMLETRTKASTIPVANRVFPMPIDLI